MTAPVGRWNPPRAPDLSGPYTPNVRLDDAELWEIPDGRGPEDVAIDAEGRVYTGLDDGRILRFPPDGGPPAVVADVGGRPLGIELDADGRLVVCDSREGRLLRVDPASGATQTLVEEFEGRHLAFVNNATIAADGRIWFSESTASLRQDDFRTAFVLHTSDGSVFVHDPRTGETERILSDLYFANGVALSADDSFLVVAETARYQLTRFWLSGDRVGQREVLVGNLPGFPDNVSLGAGGVFWVALANRRDPNADRILPYPALRRVLSRLPDRFLPEPDTSPIVLGVDADGNVVENLQGEGATFGFATGAREHDGWLYVGSLTARHLARVRL